MMVRILLIITCLCNTNRMCKSHWPKWGGGWKEAQSGPKSFQNSFLKEHVSSDGDSQHYLTGESSY